MPYQNRVTPWGDVIAVADRGLFMGNRGCLHDSKGQLKSKHWARKPWIICKLEFKGRKRSVMSPGQYTELFFLDEATALAAGHRPCATCRRTEYDRFKMLWLTSNKDRFAIGNSITDIDEILHKERLNSAGKKRVWYSSIDLLPNGAFVQMDNPNEAWLVYGDKLLMWSSTGYTQRIEKPSNKQVSVLTPESIVRVLAVGYEPVLHSSTQTLINSPTSSIVDIPR